MFFGLPVDPAEYFIIFSAGTAGPGPDYFVGPPNRGPACFYPAASNSCAPACGTRHLTPLVRGNLPQPLQSPLICMGLANDICSTATSMFVFQRPGSALSLTVPVPAGSGASACVPDLKGQFLRCSPSIPDWTFFISQS